MKSRHFAREIALQILYREDVLRHTQKTRSTELTQEGLNFHFQYFKVPTEIQSFISELVLGMFENLSQIDALLEKHAQNWKLSRMGFIDRNLLRMAVHELLHFPTPPHVIIDEAVELAKQFGTEETPAFVNAILDSIKQAKITSPS